jgi:hypothetical protein
VKKYLMRKRTTPLTYITVRELSTFISIMRMRKSDIKFVRTSSVGVSMDCDWDSRCKMSEFHTNDENNTDTDATSTGTAFHKVLEDSQGRRFPHELQFVDFLKTFEDPRYGYMREFHCSNGKTYVVCAHFDDLQVTMGDIVSDMEYKTTSETNFDFVKHWKFPIAKLQTCVYVWVIDSYLPRINDLLEARLQDLHYRMDTVHGTTYYNSSTFQVLGYPLKVYYDEQRVEKDLDRVFCMLEDWRLCIFPHPFKCYRCARTRKATCPNPAKCSTCARNPAVNKKISAFNCEDCKKPEDVVKALEEEDLKRSKEHQGTSSEAT